MPMLKHFRFWCQSVIPLVYDDSLSYYEVLCKCVKYVNNLIDSDKEITNELKGIEDDVRTIQEWINTYDVEQIRAVVDEYIQTGVYFGLTDDGYFVAYIPENWDEIQFNTTGYDITVPTEPDYGHLILSY